MYNTKLICIVLHAFDRNVDIFVCVLRTIYRTFRKKNCFEQSDCKS